MRCSVRIERVGLDLINLATYNPRKDLQPGDREYQELERSIARFDAVEPLVWNERSGNLVSGHQRIKILRARGDTEVDVSVVDLDQPEEMALNIALNKTGGDWDNQKLFEALSVLDATDGLLALTGFDHEAMEGLARDLAVAGPLFTPAEPGTEEVAAGPVTDADIADTQKAIDKKFQRRRAAEEVICPSCGHTFAIPPDRKDFGR